MVLPLLAVKVGVKAGKWAGQKVAGKVADKYGDKINEKLGDKFGDRFGGVAEKMGGKLGVTLPGFKRGQSETTPYLGKWDRISQVWINRWTILLLLVLARVLISTSSVDDNIEDAKEKVISACLKLEEAGGVMASMPHYMSSGINEMTAAGIEGTINGVVTVATLLISGVENLIIFIIGLWKSTWLCLISALVQGAFDVAEKVVESAAELAKAATSGVADVLSGAEKVIDGFVDTVNKIPFAPNIPDVKLGDAINTLKNLSIDPSKAMGAIADVKDKVPTYEELEAEVGNIISIPFNLAKDSINDKWGNYTFDRNVLPVAAKEEVAICSNDERIPGFFADLAKTVNTLRGIFIAVVVIAALLAMLYFAWMEMRRWSQAEATVDMANEKAHDLFDAAWITEHPYLARFAFWVSEKMTTDPDKQLLIRWTIAYGTSPPALFILSLAVSGIITCVMQYILLNVLRSEIPKLADSISGMAAGIVTALDSTSVTWANDTNLALASFQDDVNDSMFGNLKDVTGAVNDSLTKFTDIINSGLNTAFGDTPFMSPLKSVVDCVLLDKVEKVQLGLTWVEQHAHLSFPTLANDTFSIKNLASNGTEARAFLNDPEAATNAEISSSVSKVTDRLKTSVTQEILISMALLLVYFAVVLMGVGRAVWGAHHGINGSRPGGFGGNNGGNGGDAVVRDDGHDEYPADAPPVDVDENGNHWVEHDGVQYMIGSDGEYVIGEDGQYVTRASRRGDDLDDDDIDNRGGGGGYSDEKAGHRADYDDDGSGNPFDDHYAAQGRSDVPPSYQSPHADDGRKF